MYYVAVNINGTPKYLHKNRDAYDLCNTAENSIKFNTEKEAQDCIKKVTGAYSVLKPHMRAVTDKETVGFYTNGKAAIKVTPHEYQDGDYLSKQIDGIYADLQKRLKDCDDECLDLEHYMELRDLDVQRGYKAYKMMHDARQKRRKIKDEMLLLDNVKKMIVCTEDALKQRDYTPRVRKDILYHKE